MKKQWLLYTLACASGVLASDIGKDLGTLHAQLDELSSALHKPLIDLDIFEQTVVGEKIVDVTRSQKIDQALLEYLFERIPELKLLLLPCFASAEATQKDPATPEFEAVLKDAIKDSPYSYGNAIEILRTLTAMKCLYWIKNDNHIQFTAGQVEAVKLKNEKDDPNNQWKWLTDLYATTVTNQEMLDAQFYALALNDIGKVKALIVDIHRATGSTTMDHDELLKILLTHDKCETLRKQYLKTYGKLSPKTKKYVLVLLAKGGNIPQFGQLESVPAEAKEFGDWTTEWEKNYALLHFMCDVAGAVGFMNSSYSMALVKPAVTTYQNIQKALETNVPYTTMLDLQKVRFGYDKNANLEREDIVKIRLASMLRSDNPTNFQQIASVYNSIPEKQRSAFVLAFAPYEQMPQYKFEYAPALLVGARDKATAEANKQIQDEKISEEDKGTRAKITTSHYQNQMSSALLILKGLYRAVKDLKFDWSNNASVTIHAGPVARLVKAQGAVALKDKTLKAELINNHEAWAYFEGLQEIVTEDGITQVKDK